MSEASSPFRDMGMVRGSLAIVALLAGLLTIGTPWVAVAFLAGAYGIAQGHAWSWMVIAGTAASQLWTSIGILAMMSMRLHLAGLVVGMLGLLLFTALLVLALLPQVRAECSPPPAVR